MGARITPATGSKSDKIWRDAIHRAVKRYHTDGKTKRLELMAEKLVDAALSGDITALREIGDRLDGRPAQSVSHENADGSPISVVIATAIPAGDAEEPEQVVH